MNSTTQTTAPCGNGPRLWTRGDLDGFFGLFSNSLANTLTACCRANSLPDPEGLTP